MTEIVLKNERIINFYNTHKNIDVETINIFFCDMMEKMMEKMDTSLNTNLASQLIENMKVLQQEINTIKENVNKTNQDMITQFSLKLSELKKENIEDMKMILTNNTMDKVAPLLQNYTTSVIDKTNILINDLLPKNQDVLLKEVNSIIKNMQNSLTEETKKLSNNNTIDKNTLEQFISQFDQKFSQSILQSQTTINNLFSTTESRLDKKITEVRDLSLKTHNSEETLQADLSRILKKMENSSIKGKISENILYNILVSLYPTGEITSVGTQKETGDIILERKGKPKILIENKNYSCNVNQEEVKKFIRDTETQNCCGLFLSQNTGISLKNNFEINLQNGNVLLYVHEANNDSEKIKIAIDLIDNFKLKLDELNSEKEMDGDIISKENLDEINKEYQNLILNKISIIKNIKDNSEKLIKQIETIEFPNLEKYLSTKYAFSKSSSFICKYCEFIAKNQQSLSAHLRGCKSKEHEKPVEKSKIVLTTPIIEKTQEIQNKFNIVGNSLLKNKVEIKK
jgi:hypothetical protein